MTWPRRNLAVAPLQDARTLLRRLMATFDPDCSALNLRCMLLILSIDPSSLPMIHEDVKGLAAENEAVASCYPKG